MPGTVGSAQEDEGQEVADAFSTSVFCEMCHGNQAGASSPPLHPGAQGNHAQLGCHLMGNCSDCATANRMSLRGHVTALSHKNEKDTESSEFQASKLDRTHKGRLELSDLQ